MRPESARLIEQLLDDAGATGEDRTVLHETLTELVEAVLAVELPKPLDPTTRTLLRGALDRHPELAEVM
jgi:hypothetical protein